jgi:hypothetical protein
VYVRHAPTKYGDPDTAAAIMAEHGFTPTAPYPGLKRPWPCVCIAAGHPGKPRLENALARARQGRTLNCWRCFRAKQADDQRLSDAEARAVIRAAGAEPDPLIPYRTAGTPWPSTCRNGHRCAPSVNNIRSGQGVCHLCTLAALKGATARGSDLAAFLYLVRFTDSDGTPFVKVGIGLHGVRTNRLTTHERSGGHVLEVIYAPRNVAYAAEQRIIAAYRDGYRYRPLGRGSWSHGRECFTDAAPIKLDHWIHYADDVAGSV